MGFSIEKRSYFQSLLLGFKVISNYTMLVHNKLDSKELKKK